MKKTSIDIRERIAVRAYFMWLDHYRAGVVNAVLPGNDLGYWLAAEAIEKAYAERRAAAAAKAAETRRAKRIPTAPVAALVTRRQPTIRRATAH